MLKMIQNSRKFRMGMTCLLTILTLFLLTGAFPILSASLTPAISGIVAIYGIYCGMNVANKYALGKAQGATVEGLNGMIQAEAEEGE